MRLHAIILLLCYCYMVTAIDVSGVQAYFAMRVDVVVALIYLTTGMVNISLLLFRDHMCISIDLFCTMAPMECEIVVYSIFQACSPSLFCCTLARPPRCTLWISCPNDLKYREKHWFPAEKIGDIKLYKAGRPQEVKKIVANCTTEWWECLFFHSTLLHRMNWSLNTNSINSASPLPSCTSDGS